MRYSDSLGFTPWHKFWIHWYTFTAVLNILRRQETLAELIAWAKRKRLVTVRRRYELALVEEDGRLLFYRLRFRWLTFVAVGVYVMGNVIIPNRHLPRRRR